MRYALQRQRDKYKKQAGHRNAWAEYFDMDEDKKLALKAKQRAKEKAETKQSVADIVWLALIFVWLLFVGAALRFGASLTDDLRILYGPDGAFTFINVAPLPLSLVGLYLANVFVPSGPRTEEFLQKAVDRTVLTFGGCAILSLVMALVDPDFN